MSGSARCVLCQRATDAMTCARCLTRLDETLESIVEYYALLPSVLLPGSVLDDMPHGKRVDAPAPVRLEVLAMSDPRSKWIAAEGSRPIPYVLGILECWARLVREERRLSVDGEPTVVGEVGLLRRHLSWVGSQPWIDEFAAEIRQLRRDLQQVAGESPPKSIGPCPAERIEDGKVVTCGAPLWAPLTGDTVQCRRCKATWDRATWQILGQAILEGDAS